MAREGYLHRVLADGALPFRYRSRVRELLGLPVETGIRVEFARSTWREGFAYPALSPDASEFSGAPSLWFDVPATTPDRGDSWMHTPSLGVPTPPPTQGMPPTQKKTARKIHDAAVHSGPGTLARPVDAAVAARPVTDTTANGEGSGAPTALADRALGGPETTLSTPPARLGTTAALGPKSPAGCASRSHEAVPATAPTSSNPTVIVPGRTTQASGSSPGQVAPTGDARAIHNAPLPTSTGARQIPIAEAVGPATDTTANAEGSSAPTAFGDRAVALAETRSSAQPEQFPAAALAASSVAGRRAAEPTPVEHRRAGEPAVSHHREPVRSRDHPGKHALRPVGRSQARSRVENRPVLETGYRTSESPRSAAVAHPPTGAACAPGDQRRAVIVVNPDAESMGAAAFWERRHINWLRLRPLR